MNPISNSLNVKQPTIGFFAEFRVTWMGHVTTRHLVLFGSVPLNAYRCVTRVKSAQPWRSFCIHEGEGSITGGWNAHLSCTGRQCCYSPLQPSGTSRLEDRKKESGRDGNRFRTDEELVSVQRSIGFHRCQRRRSHPSSLRWDPTRRSQYSVSL